jgi:peptidoglycan/LPS O-acetylase OafA/YrhL
LGRAGRISRGFSLYLDLFRVMAALIVVSAHATMPAISGGHYVFPFGEDAVQAFFVLSGFVIASVADGREGNFRLFAIARLSRLWSVLIPALLIGPLLVHLGFYLWHEGFLAQYQNSIFATEFPRSIAAAFFSNEIWFFALTPVFNIPLWSIGFEFWYYLIFAIYAFAPKRFKWFGVIAASSAAGPQILLLMPAWILGAAMYRYRDRINIKPLVAWMLLGGTPIAILIAHSLHVAPMLRSLYRPILGEQFLLHQIFFARDFIWQNLVGVAIAAHLIGAYSLLSEVHDVSRRLARLIRWSAGLTYSIYLLHFPVELVIVGRLHAWPDGPAKVAVILMGATLVSALFGLGLEPLKIPLRNLMLKWTGRRAAECAPGTAQ